VSPAAPVAAEGATTPDGFLTLAATPPVEIDSGFVDVAGLPTVFFYEQTAPHDSVTLTRGSCVPDSVEMGPGGGLATMCAAGGAVRVSVNGSEEFVDRIVESLQVIASPAD
jgi:hypothetical protein